MSFIKTKRYFRLENEQQEIQLCTICTNVLASDVFLTVHHSVDLLQLPT
jgi:hypothetical protein